MKIGDKTSRAVDSEDAAITFVSTAAVPIYDDTDDLIEALLSTTPGTASLAFNLNQISKSRCNTAYTLTVTASDLVLVKSETGAKVAINRSIYEAIDANGAAVNSVTDDEKFTKASVTVAAAEIANPDTGRVVPSAANNVLTATYNGAMVNANAGELTLGTATVSWTTNSDAKAGDYQARVLLTVATV